MRTLTKWFIIAIASPFMAIGFVYELVKEAFNAGQVRYALCMDALTKWVEGD